MEFVLPLGERSEADRVHRHERLTRAFEIAPTRDPPSRQRPLYPLASRCRNPEDGASELWGGRPVIVGDKSGATSTITFAMRLESNYIFADGFEQGRTTLWSGVATP